MISNSEIWGGVLCLARVSPLLSGFSFPVFSRMPMIVRVIFAIVFSALLFANLQSVSLPRSMPEMVVSLLSEMILGMVFIFSLKMVFGAIDFIGRTLDTHMGFGAASVINPLSKEQASLIGNILTWGATLAVISTGVHLEILKLLAVSVEVIPVGAVNLIYQPSAFISYLSGVFIFTLMLFSPVITSLLLLDLIIGLVARTMPQMNVYFVTLPLKLFIGILVLAITLKTAGLGLVEISKGSVHFLTGL